MNMERKVILPFEESPYIKMYHYLAFRWGIIQGNAKEDITPWMCNKHVNCTYNEKKPIIPFEIAIWDTWPDLHIQYLQITREFTENMSWDLVDIWRRMISLGCYPRGAYNEEHIPAKYPYKKFYHSHDYLLIGYDDDERVFHSVGYLPGHEFKRFTIPYDNMRESLLSLRVPVMYLEFLSYAPVNGLALDIDTIMRDLSEYINSTTSVTMSKENVQFGMEAIRALNGRFAREGENEGIDFRFTRGIMEHKFLMKTRVDYLTKNGYAVDAGFCDAADLVYKMSEKIHMLGLKYNMTQRKGVLDSLTAAIDEMLEIESEYLPKFLLSLESGRRNDK